MHAYFYNEAIFDLHLRPRTPLLIKAGRSGEEAIDPTLPDMAFVRMMRPGQSEEEIYIPGSSLRGVVRGHAEKLLRSVATENKVLACDPTQTGSGGRIGKACFAGESNTAAQLPGDKAYLRSCYACKLFGNTALAGRVRVNDLYLTPELAPLLTRRYGVAIDRVTGAVAQGPFEIEILTDAQFAGRLTIRNFTLGQLGLMAATLLDLGDGLVSMGYGKSRGLGRVEINFHEVQIRTLQKPNGQILGIGALARPDEQKQFGLPNAENEQLTVNLEAQRVRGFYTMGSSGNDATRWLEKAAGLWVKEVGA